ncbi:MAG: type II toxin-antitoxin system RelE/ParE family toxin [Terracidiphilus sp.]|jgi:mRNA interferase RelE/StbE
MMWNLIITGPAQKNFQKLPQRDQERVKAILVAMQDDPFLGDLKRLKGTSTAWRRRVGNYRIIYDLYFEERLIVISAILRRTSTTYE